MDHKLISSFGRRKARKLRNQSQKAYDDLLPLVKIDAARKLFEMQFPEVWLEIGFGGGEHMLEQLAQNPSIAMIGCEPFMNGVAKFLAHLSPEDYNRIRIWHEDVRFLLDMVPFSYFQRVFILFSDPWPKKRHYRRRLISSEFMEKLWPSLSEGALLHIASDDASYVEQIQDVLYDYPNLLLCEGPPSADPLTWSSRPQGWPETRYEQKALAQNKKCAYMIFQKKENL